MYTAHATLRNVVLLKSYIVEVGIIKFWSKEVDTHWPLLFAADGDDLANVSAKVKRTFHWLFGIPLDTLGFQVVWFIHVWN